MRPSVVTFLLALAIASLTMAGVVYIFWAVFLSGSQQADRAALQDGQTSNRELGAFVFRLDKEGHLTIFPREGDEIEVLVPQAVPPSPSTNRVVWFIERKVGGVTTVVSFPDWVCGPEKRGCLAITAIEVRPAR